MIEALEKNDVEGILMDTYMAGEYKKRLKNFQLQGIIEHVTRYGVAFLDLGVQYAPCIRDYIYSRQSDISELIAKTVKFLEVSKQAMVEKNFSDKHVEYTPGPSKLRIPIQHFSSTS